MIDNLPFEQTYPETKLALVAVQKATDIVLNIYKQDFSVSQKDDNEPLTQADIQSNQVILKSLSQSELPILSKFWCIRIFFQKS